MSAASETVHAAAAASASLQAAEEAVSEPEELSEEEEGASSSPSDEDRLVALRKPQLSIQPAAAALAPVSASPSSASSSSSSSLAALRSQHRALPSRSGTSGKRSAAIGNRLRVYAAQQRLDGVYCLLTVTKRPRWEEEQEAEAGGRPDGLSDDGAAASDSDSSTSESSTSDSESAASSPSSSSPSPLLTREQRQQRRRKRRRAREQQAERERRKKAREQQLALFILNKHGGCFGKQPDAPLPSPPAPTSASAPSPPPHRESRKSGRGVVLDDGYVSKRHMQVWGERGRWYVQDCGSLNGTFVRKRRRGREAEAEPAAAAGGVLDVERCVMRCGYGYEQSMRHLYDGYRLSLHRVFLLGSLELMVVAVVDEETDTDASSHHVTLQCAAAPDSTTATPASSPLSLTVTAVGATIGSSPSCSLCLPEPSVAPHHASVSYSGGRFYLEEAAAAQPSSSSSPSLWARLSPSGEESAPHVLCHGDTLRVGFTELLVSIRAIPPSKSGGFGAGTAGSSSALTPTAASRGQSVALPAPAVHSNYDVGACLEGNFAHAREMQDRVVVVEGFGGDAHNAFFGVFDGHQERTVADFAAAALHHNLLEEIAALQQQMQEAAAASPLPMQASVSFVIEKEKAASEASVSVSSLSVASTTVDGAACEHERRGSGEGSDSLSVSGGRAGEAADSRHRRLSSDRSEARIGSSDADEDEEEDEDGLAEMSASRRPPLSISIQHDPVSASCVSPYSASSASSANKPPTTPPPAVASAPSFAAPGVDLCLAVTRAYRRTSAQIRGLSESALYSGSTAVTALLFRQHAADPAAAFTSLIVANLGDSHAYLLTASRLTELSTAHSASNPVEQQRVRASGGRITGNNRLAGCLEVTRAFGDLGLVAFGLSDEPAVKELRLTEAGAEAARFLLLCSDGVDVLGVDGVEAVLRDGEQEGWEADRTAQELLDRAMHRKSRDNISAVLVDLRAKDRQRQQQPQQQPVVPPSSALSARSNGTAFTFPIPSLPSRPPPAIPSSLSPALPSPRMRLQPLAPSPAGSVSSTSSKQQLHILTESLTVVHHPHDSQSSSAPPAEHSPQQQDGLRREVAQSQPASAGHSRADDDERQEAEEQQPPQQQQQQ